MTDRERWTVYPLLFLTLGIAVKDKLLRLSNVDTVLCNTLVVHDGKGNEKVVIASTPAGGLVRAQGTKTGLSVLVGHANDYAGVMFLDTHGNLHPSLAIQTVAPRKPSGGQAGAPSDQGQAPANEPDSKQPEAPPSKTPEQPIESPEK
jgi:hypothetical protein